MEMYVKTSSLVASVLLATVMVLAPAGFARGQDANDEDPARPEMSVPNLSGCWQGNAFNDSQGNTMILFVFGQTKNKISKKSSSVDLQSATHVHGAIAGTVKPTEFTFHGKVFTGCNIKGMGFIQNDGSLSGNYRYFGVCFEHQFTGGEFSKVVLLGPTCP